MIDFNTVLNTLLDQIIEQASMPLIKRIVDLEEQVKNPWRLTLSPMPSTTPLSTCSM